MGRQLAGDHGSPLVYKTLIVVSRQFVWVERRGGRRRGGRREGREEGGGGLLVGFGGLAVQSQVFFLNLLVGCLLSSALTPLVSPALPLLSSCIANGFTTLLELLESVFLYVFVFVCLRRRRVELFEELCEHIRSVPSVVLVVASLVLRVCCGLSCIQFCWVVFLFCGPGSCSVSVRCCLPSFSNVRVLFVIILLVSIFTCVYVFVRCCVAFLYGSPCESS